MPRLKTIKRFEEWIKDEANVEDILQRVADCGKLQKVCLEIKQPYTLVHPYLHSTPELKVRYEAARAAWAERLHDETLEIADSVKPETGPVSKAKLQCDMRVQSAKAWHRDRFGDAKDAGKGGGITVIVDRSCGGSVAVTDGKNRVLVAGGVSGERVLPSPEALPAGGEGA